MNLDKFQGFPDETRLWVYGFESPLGAEQKRQIQRKVTAFLSGWATHGIPVKGSFDFFEDHFVVLAGFAPGGISGCAVDASVRVFKELHQQGLDLLDHGRIYFRDEKGAVRTLHFTDFQEAAAAGRISARTPVFDTHVSSLGQLRKEGLEKEFGVSWHARAFPLPETVAR